MCSVVWIISAFIPPPFRFVLWGIGLVIDFATPITARRLPQFAPYITSTGTYGSFYNNSTRRIHRRSCGWGFGHGV